MNPVLRAPTDDGGVLVKPPFDQVGAVLAENRRRLAANIAILDRPLSDLQSHARGELLWRAHEYAGGEPRPSFQHSSFVMAGHQPELFHPGVWVKNFALHGLARQYGLTPLNLIVDNDIVKGTSLPVPAPGDRPHLSKLPFDAWREGIPYEERRVLDDGQFDSMPERVAELTAGWPWRPLLREFWQDLPRHVVNLGERLAAGRRAVERRWGCRNLELPVSHVCRTEAFAWFACHLLENLSSFHTAHNEAVTDYRRRNGIRNAQHPVPDLGSDGAWLEAPLWVWSSERPRRERLFARRAGNAVELRAGRHVLPALPCGQPAAWLDLERRGCKIRCRALTTTLFARLFLADLFVHGIGGAKYDELTDTLMRRFYGVEPPSFLVLSATVLLPFARFPVTEESVRRLAYLRRDVAWNPQRHLNEVDAGTMAAEWAAEKQAWIDHPANTPAARRERFAKLRAINARLEPLVAARENELAAHCERSERELAANAILGRRDYPFCLYPEDRLRNFFQRFLGS